MTLENNLSLTEAISAIIFSSAAPVETMKLAAHFEVTVEAVAEAADAGETEPEEAKEKGLRKAKIRPRSRKQ